MKLFIYSKSRGIRRAGILLIAVLNGIWFSSNIVNAQEDPDLIAYEGFDYEVDTSIENQDGGYGWKGAWGFRRMFDGKGDVVQDSAMVVSGSLKYGDLTTTGNHVHLYGDFGKLELARELEEVIIGEDGTSTYLSFLGQRVGPEVDPDMEDPHWDDPDTPEREPYPYGDNLYPMGATPVRLWNDIDRERLSVGNRSWRDENTWRVFGAGLDHPTEVSFSEEVVFIVVRIDHHGVDDNPEKHRENTADDIYLWVNPDLDAGDDISTADIALEGPYDVNDDTIPVDYSHLAWISPFVETADGDFPHAEALVDEIRLGKTWDSVVPRGEAPPDTSWGPFEPDENGDLDTGVFMSWVNVKRKPWIWNYSLQTYVYMPAQYLKSNGGWGYTFNQGSETRNTELDSHWGGFSMDSNQDVKTGLFLGWLNVRQAPYLFNYALDTWMYVPQNYVSSRGTWTFFMDLN